MKKKSLFALLLLPLLLSGCNTPIIDGSYDTYSIDIARKTGEIGAFDLLEPGDNFSTDEGFTFKWEEATNCDYYQLEIASTKSFVSDDEDEVYVRESNLSFNNFDLTYSLPKKDIKYYWKVTAINKDHKKVSNQTGTFNYRSKKSGELIIEIEEAEDWVLHKEGSYADIQIDRSNFFNNNQNSLAITFDKEHTCQGIPKSDGWIVVTKTEDRELYGTDSFFFNFYYSGHDATVLIRVLDYDGEYWHKQVQISNNSKQTILMKYEDFELRTAGTNVFNRKFDWEHIRYFEIVFERTFGDGICLISNIKAVNFKDYSYMFMDKMDFRSTPMSEWTYENYNFEKTISEDGTELTLNYPVKTTENPNGFYGYGFQNANVYRYFVQGDALRMKVKYTGSSTSAMFYFRILEEDNDRWQFKMPFSSLIKDDYKEIIIPLKAFQRVEYMNGDGAKQFYYIQKFNIGLADNYSSGTLSVKDIEVIKIDDVVESRKRIVGEDGCIEDFNDYNLYTEIYYYWEQSSVNKDEAMKLDTIHKAGGTSNKYCAEFDYKADMEQAVYQLYMDTKAVKNKNAFSIWLKDASIRSGGDTFAYLSDDDIVAEMTIQLTMDSGEWYRYTIDKVKRDWHKYTIAFSDFTLINEQSLVDDPVPLDSEHIIHLAFGFKYLYYDQNGKHVPTYAIANPVYLDEIYFVSADKTSIEEISSTIKPDEDNPNVTTVETMEGYSKSEEIFDYWSYGYEKEYNEISLSNDVSSNGGTNSIKMHYKGSDSVSYVRATQFANNVTARGVAIDIKGDGKATVYLNLNLRIGSTLYKMRYYFNVSDPMLKNHLKNVSTVWTHYELGFEMFKDVNGTTRSISATDAKNIESISFGIANTDKTESDIYVDNIRLSYSIGYAKNTGAAI